MVGVLLAVAVAFLLLAGGVCSLVWAVSRKRPRRRWLIAPPAAATVTCALAIGVALVPRIGETPERADCSDFSLRPGDWRSALSHKRVTLADGIDTCGALDGASTARVQNLLGKPDAKESDKAGQTYWSYYNLNATDDEYDDDGYSLTLRLQEGHVVAADGPAYDE